MNATLSIISPWCYLSVLLVIYLNVYTYLIIVHTCLAYLLLSHFIMILFFPVVDALSAKPPALSSVFFWGIGVSSPVKLPLPSSDTQVTQVSTGRTQKAAVTKNGRLFVWEVQITRIITFYHLLSSSWWNGFVVTFYFSVRKIHVTKFTCMHLNKNWNMR